MRIRRPLAAFGAGALIVGAGLIATAYPAAADPRGPDLGGQIYLLSAPVSLDAATDADVVNSGGAGINLWKSLAVTSVCPGPEKVIWPLVRIPVPGNPDENTWPEIAISPQAYENVDSQGRVYSLKDSDGFNKPEIVSYLNGAGNHDSSDFTLIVVCQDFNQTNVGYVSTKIRVQNAGAADGHDITWSRVAPPPSLGGGGSQAVATTTTLSGTASGPDLQLDAVVAPDTATGTVTFTEGASTLGTATVSGGVAAYTVASPPVGVHTYQASFAPDDTAAYQPSQSSAYQVTVGLTQSGDITITLGVPPAAAGALTLTVPPSATVPLTGVRDSGNTQVSASGALPQIVVADTRSDALLTAWEVSVHASDFTGSAGTIAAKYLGWTPAVPQIVATDNLLQVAAGQVVPSFLSNPASLGLGGSQTLARTTANGRGTTTLGGQLTMAIPGTSLEGSYTSTLTVTLISG